MAGGKEKTPRRKRVPAPTLAQLDATADPTRLIHEWLATFTEAGRTRGLLASPLMEVVARLYPDVADKGEVAYLFVRGMDQRPVCLNCGGAVSWFKNRYARTCSHTCANIVADTVSKAQETMRQRRLTDPEFEERRTQARNTTMQEKYGAKVGPQHRANLPETWSHLNKAGRETLMERHGVGNPGQLPAHGAKLKDALLRKHGVASVTHMTEWNDRVAETRRARIAAMLPEKLHLIEVIAPDKKRGEANFRYVLKCTCGWRDEVPSETFKFRMRTMQDVCTRCTGISTARSIKEKSLHDFVGSIYDGKIVTNDRTTLRSLQNGRSRRLEMDLYLPDKRVGIEFCGLFWHSTSDPKDTKSRDYHKVKHTAAEEAGVRLITIFEDEWQFRREIVEKRLKVILGVEEKRIYARQCEIVAIDGSTARTFCDQNHIQGYTPATHKYGLYHEERLVAVMTFSRPTLAKGRRKAASDEWELSRFCSTSLVVGGASRLFKHFVKEQKPSRIWTYSDLRWNTGGLYTKLGFVAHGVSRPNYWYVENHMRINRFSRRKTRADDQTKTEFENRAAAGQRWIWDCGNAKYLWTRPKTDENSSEAL